MQTSRYRAPDGRVMFVHDGISRGESWGTYWRKPSGSLKRYRGIRCERDRETAQRVLDAYARMRQWELV